jgi:hypothetical protein
MPPGMTRSNKALNLRLTAIYLFLIVHFASLAEFAEFGASPARFKPITPTLFTKMPTGGMKCRSLMAISTHEKPAAIGGGFA